MLKLTKEKIREIYQELDCGFVCFYNKKSSEIKSLPDLDSNPYADGEMSQDISDEIDANFDDYHRFDKMQSHESFQLMAGFIDTLPESRLRERLIDALNRPKPFRNFKFVIDNSGAFRDQWFAFKEQEYCKWIEAHILELNNLEDFKNRQKDN